MLVTSSQVLRGPSPMMENSSKPPLRLATALPETGTGMAGNLGSPDAPRRIAAPSTSRTKADSFFIPEILPHVQRFDFDVRRQKYQIFRTRFFRTRLSRTRFPRTRFPRTRSCGGTRGRRLLTRLREPGLRGGRGTSA